MADGVEPTNVDPADGSEVETLQSITLSWNYLYVNAGEGDATVAFNGETKTIDPSQVTNKKGSSNILTGESTPGTTTLSLNYTEPGEYTITLPAGYVKLTNSAYAPSFESSTEIVLHYTVKGGEVAAPAYTATPESGSQLPKLSSVKLEWGTSTLTAKEGKVTLKINGGETQDITALCSVYPGSEPMWGGIVPGKPGNMEISFDPAYTEPGTYEITIPAGYVNVNAAGAPNGAIVLTYTVTGASFSEPEPIVNPADGSELESIDTVTIDWGIAISEGHNMGGFYSSVTVMKDDEEYYDTYAEGYIEGDKVLIYFEPEITEAGEYEIIIPDDYVNFTDYDEPNTEFSIYYTVKAGGEEPEPGPAEGVDPTAIDPEDGSELEELALVKITWPRKIINEGKGSVTLTHDGVTTDITDCVESLGSFSGTATTTITFEQPYTEPGEYKITMPAGFVTLNDALVGLGDPNNEIVITYTLPEPKEPAPAYTYEPEADTEPFETLPKEVKVYFGDRTDTLVKSGKGEATLTVGEEAPVEISDKITIDSEEEGEGWDLQIFYSVTIDLTDYAESEGNCTIVIPEGYFDMGGISIGGSVYNAEPSPEVIIAYIVDSTDGIKGIEDGAEGSYRIFTINGTLVTSSNPATLGKGLYIINGKKLIIR